MQSGHSRHMRRAALWLLLPVIAMQCSSIETRVINEKAIVAAQTAERLIADKKMAEAQAIIYQLQYLHPDDAAVRRLQNKLPIDYRANLEAVKWLGVNMVRRNRAERTSWQRVLYYLPDLIGDAKDIFSFGFTLGPQFGFDLHATRAANFTGYTGATVALGTYPKQWVGAKSDAGIEISGGPIGLNAVSGVSQSMTTTLSGSEAFAVHRPSNTLYQTYRDYWSVGGQVGFIFIGFTYDLHPIEAADFFTALYGEDLLRDNIEAAEPLKLSESDMQNLVELATYVSNGRLSAYQADYPTLNISQQTVTDRRTPLAAKSGNSGPAKVLVLNFNNRTGSKNYGYISTSLSSAIYDSMKAGFIFHGDNPDTNHQALEKLNLHAAIEAGDYQTVCDATNADYLIFGSFVSNQKNTISVVARVYSVRQKSVLLELPRSTQTDASLFSTTQLISDEVVRLMKKQP